MTFASGLRSPSECPGCLRAVSHGLLVRTVANLGLCPYCAEGLIASRRDVMTPLVVAAFARFMHHCSLTGPTERCREEDARRFWGAFGEGMEDDVRAALEVILAHAPARAREVTD